MAVVGLAKEMPGERRGAFLENDRRQYFRRYLVKTDSRYDGPKTVTNAPGLPSPFAGYLTNKESDPECKVVRRIPRETKSWQVWHVDVEYDTNFDETKEDPFLDPPKISFDFEPFREPLPGEPLKTEPRSPTTAGGDPKNEIVRWGSGIVNSAGEPFNPPAERDAARPIVTFSYNAATFNQAIAIQFMNTVNRDPWSGLKPRQALIKGIRSHQEFRKPASGGKLIEYWPTTFVFALKQETWDLSLLNIGSYYLSEAATFDDDGNITNLASIVKMSPEDSSGRSGPYLLKSDGTLATDGVPTFRNFRVYRETSFAALNITLNLSVGDTKPKTKA